MIHKNAIIEWGDNAPWKELRFIEQDLVISRAIISIFQSGHLSSKIAFRGGTALYKLFLMPPARYSEDLDFVQISTEPIGETLDKLKDALNFLGNPITKRKMSNNILLYRFEAEEPRGVKLKLKIEINCREHLNVFDREMRKFEIKNQWFTGSCNAVTYNFDELIGTKIRALYQRKKGRDLFDLYCAINSGLLNAERAVDCYKKYMSFNGLAAPTAKEYSDNLAGKMMDSNFALDIIPMLAKGVIYDPDEAYIAVQENIVKLL